MPDYYPAIQSRLRGDGRRWTITLYGLYDTASAAPSKVYTTPAHKDVSVEWGEKSAIDAPWLPSIARLKLRDPDQTVYQFLTNSADDRDVRCLIVSDDGAYRWEGFVRLKTLSTRVARWLQVPVVDVYAYDGLGQIDKLVGQPPKADREGMSLAEMIQYPLLRLADLPIRYLHNATLTAHGNTLTADGVSDTGLLNHLYSKTLARADKWQDRLRDLCKRFGVRIFQDMRVQPGRDLNAWHVAPLRELRKDRPASKRYSLRYERADNGTETLAAADWAARRTRVERPDLTKKDTAQKHPNLSRQAFSFDWSNTDGPDAKRDQGVLQNTAMEYVDPNGSVIGWKGPNLSRSGKSQEDGGYSLLVPDGGFAYQLPTPVKAGTKIQIISSARLALEYRESGKAAHDDRRDPLIQYRIRRSGDEGDWYLGVDGRWTTSGYRSSGIPQGIYLFVSDPVAYGSTLQWEAPPAAYNIETIPADGILEVRLFAPPTDNEPDTRLYIDELNVRFVEDPDTNGQGETTDQWEGAIQQINETYDLATSTVESSRQPGAEHEIESALHPGRLSSLHYYDADSGQKEPVGLWRARENSDVSARNSLFELVYDQLDTVYRAGEKRPTLKPQELHTPSSTLVTQLTPLNPYVVSSDNDGTDYVPLTCKASLRTERTEMELAPVYREVTVIENPDWIDPQ